MTKFYKYHPERPPQPSLKEQITALENATGKTAFLESGLLTVEFDITTNPEYPKSDRIQYKLKCVEHPGDGIVEWILKHNDKFYLIETVLENPDLKEIVVVLKRTNYRGVKLDGKVYWTDNELDHSALKVAVESLAEAQRKIVELIGNN